jgi:L-alanine-DL-glutamate epimerase-like enolase superfamily enzyme
MDKLLNGHNYAKAAIDIAIHDLIGKAHDIRVCDMLGGVTSERVMSYYAHPSDNRRRPGTDGPAPRRRRRAQPAARSQLDASSLAAEVTPTAGAAYVPRVGFQLT